MDRAKVDILGYGVDTFCFDDAVDYIYQTHGQIVTINPEMIEYGKKNSEFKDLINNAELVVPDGVGVKIGLKILGTTVERIPGIDLGKAILKRAQYLKKTVALVGAQQDVIENAVVNLKIEMPELNIVYYRDGYFTDENEVFQNLLLKKPDVVLVALGSPKQEFFINNIKKQLSDAIFIGLGGSFDVWAGKVKRAPKIFRSLGLEWLYRIITEPERIKRVFPTLPLFIFKVIKERLLKK